MPLILPHPIMPTLTAASSLMVAPFSHLACQLVSLSRAQVLDDKAAEPERADWLFSSARPEHAAFDYLFGLWHIEVSRVVEISTSYPLCSRMGAKTAAHSSGSWPSQPPQTKSADFIRLPLG